MAEGHLTVGQAYAYELLSRWKTVMELWDHHRINYLKNRKNQRILTELCSHLAGMWIELHPKVIRQQYLGELSHEFESHEAHAKDPKLLMSSTRTLIDMTLTIRKCLERLGVTALGELNV
jgi:hypothetical protein